MQCLNGLKALTQEVQALKQSFNTQPVTTPTQQTPPATAPVQQTSSVTAPEQQSTQNPTAAPDADMKAVLQQLSQGLTGLQNQFNTISTTPMNPPPVQTGGAANTVDY